MASNLPTPKSYEQILSDMLSAYAAKMGISDFNVGSAVSSFFEVVALSTARASGDIFQILKDFSVDRATGDTLKRLALEEGVTPISARPATGYVTVTDTSFQKVATKIYAGAISPNIGSTQIKVSDASSFASSGSVYIGRGTPNVEGPIPYASKSQVGGYWVLNLSVATTKFHNVGETVILAQGGNRAVPANAIVVSPSSGASPDVQFQISQAAVILDGEVSVSSVPVTALLPGVSGNVPRGAVKTFSSAPFSGATVTNTLPFTTGADSESDDELKVRIKRALASKGLGTATAVKAAVIGATPSDEQATIVSSEIQSATDGVTLFIDDGNGYEAKTAGVGLEPIVDSALGGEKFFQAATGGRQAPIAKAFLQSTLQAPFDIAGGDTLAIIVGEQTYEHVFDNKDFRSPGGATAYEVSASINSNTAIGFEATTAGGGTYIVIRAIAETNDSLKVTTPTTSGRDAATLLGLPGNQIDTVRIYKNKAPLSKDGKTASVFTQAQTNWSSTIQTGDTLILSVDGTASITFTFTNADFINQGTYNSVSSANSLESWVEVFNNKLTGVTAEVVGTQISIVSNLGASNRASLSIDPSSSLVSKGMFSANLGLSAEGKQADIVIDRNTGQFETVVPLAVGDRLEFGTSETEARIQSAVIPSGNVNMANDGHIWILIDSSGALVPTGVAGSTLLSVAKPSANIIRYGSTVSGAFDNVQVGDYVIVWSEEVNVNNRLEGRVAAKTSTTVDIHVTAAEYAAAVVESGVLFADGFVVFRSKNVPQKFRVTAGAKTIDDVAQELQAQTAGIIFDVLQDEFLVMRSTSKDDNGSIFVVTSDNDGKLLNFTSGASDVSKDSLIAFYNSTFKEASLPLFVHSKVQNDTFADPIDSFITVYNSLLNISSRDPNELVSFLHPYGAIADAQPAFEYTQVKSISGQAVSIVNQPDVRRLRADDRYFVANPLDFGPTDSMIVVLDNDTGAKSFEMPFYRRAITNNSQAVSVTNFNAYDVDSGNTAQFAAAFGVTFNFANFKALMKAKKVLKAQASQSAILWRSTRWGRAGEKVRVGYDYPSAPNQGIAQVITVGDLTNIRLILKSGAAIASSIDSTTEWNVTKTINTPSAGIDQVTFTWNGTGTAPNLSLAGGEYVNIGKETELSEANTGVYRVSTQGGFAPTISSFTVQMKTGQAVAETNKATLVNGQIVFYANDPTTAADMVAYALTDLADYLTGTLVNDGGLSGSGVLTYSTYEDTGFVSSSVALLDGINWIASSSLGASPQFVFKRNLSLPTDTGYAFNLGEEVRLVPTTMDQVQRFLSVLAVTGFTTVGTVGVVERTSRLSLATDTLGSGGSVQVIGGLANQYSVPVLDAGVRLDNQYMQVSTNKVAAQGVQTDQWFRLEAEQAQIKSALFSANTAITAVGGSPSATQTTLKLLNRSLAQRYFGKPRYHVIAPSRTFRVEKQGSLVCISHTGVGSSPFFSQAVNFNDTSGGTLNVSKVTGTSEVEFIILTGNANFNGLSIGDLVTVLGMFETENNGTFLVTGVSDDGKTLRVLNSAAVNQYSFATYTFSGNSTAGDTFTIDGTALVAGTDFVIGATQADTEANLAAVIGALPNTSAVVIGNVVKVIANFVSASLTTTYSGSGVVTVSGATTAGYTFSAGAFAATAAVEEGDTMVISAPFAVLNQGKFRVIRRFNDSVWIENGNAVEEEVALPQTAVSVGVDATTSLKVNASSHSIYINWNGSGTEPDFSTAKVGDRLVLGTSFAVANRGNFMVLRRGAKLQQIDAFTMPAGSLFTPSGVGKYFKVNSAGDVNQYYVWFNANGGNSDPAPGGLTGIQVAILTGDTAAQVAVKVANVVNVATGLSAVAANGVVTVTTTGSIETTAPSNFNVPAPFAISNLQIGRRTFIEVVNPSAVNEAVVFPASGHFLVHRPQINFYEYEASVAGDKFVATGDVLGIENAGTYVIAEVLDRDTAILTNAMSSISNASLSGRETAAYVLEASPYFGYKHALNVATQPGAPARTLVTFDTNNQYEKIDEAADVSLVSLGKLVFNTDVRLGLDSYRYNTGLIAEANRIIYGDPRDASTYPGVGAAGARIYTREPLTKRIQVSIDVRLLTGVPFAQIVDQIRTAVSSLINSNKVGQSIAISAIVAAVNSVRGVRAVAISSPQYDSTHDIIVIAASQKARILDPVLDISVSQIGS